MSACSYNINNYVNTFVGGEISVAGGDIPFTVAVPNITTLTTNITPIPPGFTIVGPANDAPAWDGNLFVSGPFTFVDPPAPANAFELAALQNEVSELKEKLKIKKAQEDTIEVRDVEQKRQLRLDD